MDAQSTLRLPAQIAVGALIGGVAAGTGAVCCVISAGSLYGLFHVPPVVRGRSPSPPLRFPLRLAFCLAGQMLAAAGCICGSVAVEVGGRLYNWVSGR